MKRFKEKTVIVMGAGTDIGRATAIRFAKEGANVVLVGRNTKNLEETASAFPQDRTWIHTDNYLIVTCDMSAEPQVQELIKMVVNKFGSIDVLVNNASKITARSKDDGQKAIDSKLSSAAYTCQMVIPHLMISQGNIVNVSWLENLEDDWTIDTYHAANADINRLTRSLAFNHRGDGVRVNAVSPLILESESTNPVQNPNIKTNALKNNQVLPHSLLKRWVTPNDIAAAIVFLASDDAAMITGVELPIDGGAGIAQ